MSRKSNKKFNWARFAVAAGFLLLTLILLFSLGIFDRFAIAQNGPELEVSKSFSGQPLLGGNATVSISSSTGDALIYTVSKDPTTENEGTSNTTRMSWTILCLKGCG